MHKKLTLNLQQISDNTKKIKETRFFYNFFIQPPFGTDMFLEAP